MVSWRNWLAQESYTFKVVGSSPTETTINIQGFMLEWGDKSDLKSDGQ